jgi:hypothetical protein
MELSMGMLDWLNIGKKMEADQKQRHPFSARNTYSPFCPAGDS